MAQMKLARPRGPVGAVRPYEPSLDIANPPHDERVAEALDHIAFALAAIDHNLELLTKNSGLIVNAISTMLQKR